MANYKRLERDTVNSVIGGVCSGLAEYFCIDVTLIRVLFVLSFLFLGFGFLLYIVLWMVMPVKKLNGYADNKENRAFSRESFFENPEPESKAYSKKHNNGSIILSIIIIAIGLICLLNNFYPIGWWLWRLWPVILIVFGIIIMINSSKK